MRNSEILMKKVERISLDPHLNKVYNADLLWALRDIGELLLDMYDENKKLREDVRSIQDEIGIRSTVD